MLDVKPMCLLGNMGDDGDSSDEEMQPFVPDDVGLLTLKVNVSNNVSTCAAAVVCYCTVVMMP